MGGLRLLLILPVFLTLAACAPKGHRNIKTSESKSEPAIQTDVKADVPDAVTDATKALGENDWLPNWQVTCKAEYCPLQVGLLVHPLPPADGKVHFKRCTSFLITNKWIMSNGHCANRDRAGYFITQKINGKKIQRKIKSEPIYIKYVPGKFNDKGEEIATSGEMDVAIFELEEEIPENQIKPFSIVSGAAQKFEKLYGFVINKGQNPDEFQIESKVCEIRRHEAIFPYSLTEKPDVITSFGCELVGGNSGSPMLSDPRSLTVEAIVIGGATLDETISSIVSVQHRQPYEYEKHGTQKLSNLRCISLAGQSEPQDCIRANIDEVNRRYKAYQDGFLNEVVNRAIPNQARYGFRYSSYRFQIKTESASPDQLYEVFYNPTCRLSPQKPTKVDYPVETLKLKYDSWAQITLESVEMRMGVGTVSMEYANETYQVQTAWPLPIGEFINPEKPGLREQLGPSFAVALPICK